MTTYPSSLSPAPALTDEGTLEAALDCLLESVPLNMKGGYTPQDLFEILLRAASRGDSIEHTAQRLQGTPSGNGIRYHLDKLDEMATLESQLNAALQSRIPPKICRRQHRIAIDLHLIPYYGNPSEVEAPYIYRSQAKAGTTSFFAYATVYVVCRHKRVTLGIHAVHRQETLVATLTYLLARLSPLRVRVKRLYLDRGFYSVPVIRWLKALQIPFLMPAVIRGKTGGTRQLLRGRRSYQTPYTLNSPQYGSVSCQMRVICNYYKGLKGKHGIQYTVYVLHRVKVALHQTHRHYKDRFGIETSYRIKNQCRIRTTSKNPVTRFLFVALAFVLVNLWVYLLWFFISWTQRGGRVVYRELFALKTMLEFLSQAVERHFPVITAIYLPALE
uniref:ISH3 family transposase n=1 Tax=Trichocoleus desertorum TaxID=1481672 RepID=UPI0025B44055|nr:ISH3 family transposase [Trichocoleus desertorum]